MQERRFYLIGSEGAIRADALTGLIEVHFTDPKKSPQRIDVDAKGSHAGADVIMSQGLRRTLLEGEAPAAGMSEGIASLVTACGIDQAMDTGCVVDFAPLWATAERLS